MARSSIEAELDELLAEPPAAAARRAQARIGEPDVGGRPCALYGAGQVGRAVLARLRAAGVEPVAFADDTAAKQGQVIDGLRVVRPQEAAQRFGPDLYFVVTILNPALNFVTACRRLRERTGAHAVSFLHLAWRYPDTFLPFYQFERPTDVLRQGRDIRRAFRLLDDDESRRQYVAHLKFRLHLDHDALPPCDRDSYFPPAVLPELPADTVFVDGGAYDGDTIRGFLAHQRERFGRIYAFEPDPQNCDRLRAYVASLSEDVARRIHVYNAGVGSRRARRRFDATGNMSSSFNATGTVEVQMLPLDEVVEPGDTLTYVKLDVEGAEWEALHGGEALLRRARPVMAISVYHRPADLWKLPLHVAALDLGYRFFLRTHGEDGMDVVCYVVP